MILQRSWQNIHQELKKLLRQVYLESTFYHSETCILIADSLGTLTSVHLIQGVRCKQVQIYCAMIDK